MNYGPRTAFAEQIHSMKHRHPGESFEEGCERVAHALKDTDSHFFHFKSTLKHQQFLPGGRVQLAMGAPTATTPYNCFVSPTIPDSMDGIMDVAKYAAATMRMGGGIGYDFSPLRPRWDNITTLGAPSSGPVSFMQIFDAVCGTISSAGNRRGAMMAVLRVDHPDIEEFITAKHNNHNLTNFNLSVGVTDEFMRAVVEGRQFHLRFNERVYRTVDARNLWEKIMRSTWDWAEPGVLFIDTINRMNNLHYCERIAATNPCAEQPLPPNGACLLGSLNLAKYMVHKGGQWGFDLIGFREDIPTIVRAMDNIVDRALYPMREQRAEATSKRRMGLGVTGVANAIEAMRFEYGCPQFTDQLQRILRTLRDEAYRASAYLAAEKGAFPLYKRDEFLAGEFVEQLPPDVRDLIAKHGIRNSHLTSIAPTGTISLTADNVSSGIEPVFSTHYQRTVQYPDGPKVEHVWDYGVKFMGVEPKTAADCSADDHLNVLLACSPFVDSAVSKTCNVNPAMPWEDFKELYMKAWAGGAKGCTTFNPGGKRFGILKADDPGVEEDTQTGRYGEETEGAACYMDPETGERSCG